MIMAGQDLQIIVLSDSRANRVPESPHTAE